MIDFPKILATWLIIIGLWKSACSKSFPEVEVGKLLFANVLFRHGDRTPIDPYPNDPYRNLSYWPEGFGQLTNIGKRQHYELGKWLRERYDSLLTDEYNRDLIHVQSTDVDRTLMSAESNLAGMFPPKGAQVWNPQLQWQPIPIHTTAEKLDKVLAAKMPCPAYDEERERVLKSREIQELSSKFSDVYKILSENTGKNMTTLVDINDVYNNLYIEHLKNLTLPEWTRGIYPQPMEEASKYSFALQTWTLKLARLKSGLLVQDMISHMKNKRENKKKAKQNLWIYSAHDLTIANLLNTLGVFDLQIPPYASAVLMELRVNSNGDHNVMLFYRNSTNREPYLLTLPGCSAVCPLEKFVSLCQAVIPEDWDRECHTSSLFGITPNFPYNSFTIAALVISALLIILVAVSVSVAIYVQRRRPPTHCRGYKQLFVVPWDSSKVSGNLGMQGTQTVASIWTLQDKI